MHFTSETSGDGVIERGFTLGEVPGVLWSPEGAVGPRPLILLGHGGGQHKKAQGIVACAQRFVAGGGFAVASIDAPSHGDRHVDEEFSRLVAAARARAQAGEGASAFDPVHAYLAEQIVTEWQAVVTALHGLADVGSGPVGYRGLSLGCGLGIPFIVSDSRIRAAVLGLFGSPTLIETARQVAVPVQFLVQWDDEQVPRAVSLAVFDALGSPDKTLHANPGSHRAVPDHEIDSAQEFFARHLSPQQQAQQHTSAPVR